MRAVEIERGEYGRAADLLDQMFRLRARVFAGRLGWDVAVEEGREVDGHDDVGPTYVLAMDARGTAIGSVPTCRRTRSRRCSRPAGSRRTRTRG
ncbi:acyl-homoserine-lactone synthase [Pinisolibacter aquiterrae]|uniref:acyl-homoserine-lactone synthase n=1 Tax=Pinisolibacter aquiterrae TaxID=2815579 RepID=UPI003B75C3AE